MDTGIERTSAAAALRSNCSRRSCVLSTYRSPAAVKPPAAGAAVADGSEAADTVSTPGSSA